MARRLEALHTRWSETAVVLRLAGMDADRSEKWWAPTGGSTAWTMCLKG